MPVTSLLIPRPDRRSRRALSFGILSTYPPTACGLATFSAALANGLVGNGAEVRIVRVLDAPAPPLGGVAGELLNGSRNSVADAAGLLNQCDVAVVQHEYGLYGGPDGDEVLEVLRRLRVPSVVVAHTVLTDPTPHQRAVLVAAAALAHQVVVMSEGARQRLCTRFHVDPRKVLVIPHGATLPQGREPDRRGRPTLLTSGLIGPGKGIERVIDALPQLQDLGPSRPRYLVAGQTHPKVLAAQGDTYRHRLIEQAWRLGVSASIGFDASHRDVASLTALLHAATVVVLPYDSSDQVTSGVLVDALAAGRPVIATAFPHAVELLASGAGIVVDHADPRALAHALRRVLAEPDLAADMAVEASRLATSMAWPVVAGSYVSVAEQLLATTSAVA